MFWMNRRKILAACGSLAAAMAMAAAAQAQSFPTKLVTLVVPYPPGGTSDVIARGLTQPMSKDLGQTVIVDNQGGAGGTIAAQKLLNAPADGYGIFVGSPNELILAPLAMATVKFRSEDFQLVQKVGDLTMAILVRKDLPVASVDELVAYAAQRAKEGKPLTYGSVGNGSIYHLLGEQMSKVTGVPLVHVPYRGGSPMTQDLVGGQIDLFLGAMGANSTGLVAAGKLKMLAVISPERLNTFQNVPSVRESKALKDFTYSLWVGLFVKKGTPEPVLQALHKAITSAMVDPALGRAAEGAQVVLARPQTLAQAGQFYTESVERFRAIAKSIDLKPE